MLKGLILSSAVVFCWALGMLAVLGRKQPHDALGLMTKSFVIAIPVYFLVYWLTPVNLAVLPARMSTRLEPLGIINGSLILILLFLTCLQFYNHIHNSISLQLVIAFNGAPGKTLTVSQIEAVCGLPTLLRERVETLQCHRLVIRRGDRYYLTVAGLLAGLSGQLVRGVVGFAPIRESQTGQGETGVG